jgi:selenide,water dikinase
MGPGDLARALAGLKFRSDPNIIAGMERAEDAGVYKISDGLAIVQTVDFFTPVVDDAYDFGRIAVANALSDVYAMGGRPLTALNIVCFPSGAMDISILRDVLRGGLDMMHEAGVALLGGHTVDDPELKYGLAVTGTVHPEKVVHNSTARPGDRLVLTKPLGTGIISTALKRGAASPEAVAAIVKSMTTLNKAASEAMLAVGVSACKDITGFGLLGHAAEMVSGTDVGMVFEAAAVPVFAAAIEYAEKGMIPGGLDRNREYRQSMVDIGKGVPRYLQDILYDPQTSGGLLIAVPEKKAQRLLDSLHEAGVKDAAIVGEVAEKHRGRIRVR